MICRITAVARKVNHKLFMLRKSYLSRLMNAVMLVAMLLPNVVGTVNAAQIDPNQIKGSNIGETNLEIDLSNADQVSVYQAPIYEHPQAIQHPSNETTIDSPKASEQPKLVSREKIAHQSAIVQSGTINIVVSTGTQITGLLPDRTYTIIAYGYFYFGCGLPECYAGSAQKVSFLYYGTAQPPREIATVGDDDLPYRYTRGWEFKPDSSGSVNIRVNDSSYGDNTGAMYYQVYENFLSLEQSLSPNSACFSNASSSQWWVGKPIDAYTGNYSYQSQDIQVPVDQSIPLVFVKSYSSTRQDQSDELGYGWIHNYQVNLVFSSDPGGEAGYILLNMGDGSVLRFIDIGSSYYAPVAGISASLEKDTDAGGNDIYLLNTAELYTYTFDDNGVLLSMEDENGKELSFTYSNGLLQRAEDDSSSRYLDYSYNTAGQITTVTDHTGRSISLQYDVNDNLISLTDILGNVWDYEYDDTTNPHLLTEVVDPNNNTVERTEFDTQGRAVKQYDGNDNLIIEIVYGVDNTVTVHDGGETQVGYFNDQNQLEGVLAEDGSTQGRDYNSQYLPETFTDQNGNQTQITWNTRCNAPSEVIDAEGNTVTITYDTDENPSSILDPRGYTTSIAYTDTNFPHLATEITDPFLNTTSFTYDSQGHVLTSEDAKGETTTYTYDTSGQLLTQTDALNNTISYTYDSLGRVVETTDPSGVVTKNEYNAAGWVTKTIRNYDVSRLQNEDNLYNITTTYTYDAIGNQTSVEDTYGALTQYAYDANNRVVTITDPLGNQTHKEYDSEGKLTADEDQLGRRTTYTYDTMNRLITVTDAAGNSQHTAYNTDGTVASTTNALGQTTSYTYDALQRVETVADPTGGTTTTVYDEAGNVVSSTDALGRTTIYEYDALNRLIKQTDPSGEIVENFYDANGNVTQTIDARGHATTYTYDVLNRVETITDAAGNVTTYTYDALGRQTGVTDPKGHSTSYDYDLLGRRITVTDHLGNISTTTYDALGRTVGSQNAAGKLWQSSYDVLGRLDQQTDPLGGLTGYTYDAVGNRLTVTDANGHTTSTTYDNLNRPVSITDPNGNMQTTAYNALGNVTSVTNAAGNTINYSYDNLNRQSGVVNANGNTTSFGYDAVGNRTSVQDANGIETRFEYDTLNRLTAVVENYQSGGAVDHQTNVNTTYTYDENGNRLSIIDGNGHTRTFTYDAVNRLTGESDALGNSSTNSYDAAGNLISVVDANGATIAYEYDALNRLTKIDYPAPDADALFSYDSIGQMSSMQDGLGTTTWTYDDLGRPTSVVDPFNSTVSYGYDAVGNRTSLVYPGTKSVAYTYDPANRLEQVTGWNSEITSYTYDDANRLIGMSLPNGITAIYDYDNASRLTDISYTQAEDILTQYSYIYDDVGNRTQMQEIVELPGQSMTSVEVTVKDNLDQPVAGFAVHALDGQVETGISAITDDAGVARISLPDGNYRFRVQRDGTDFYSDAINHCTVPTCTEASIELSILAGTVVDDLGSPAPGIQVSVYDDAGDTGIRGITDALGLVELAVPDGCYRLYSEEEGLQVFSNEDCTAPAHAATLNIDLADALTTTVTTEDDAGVPQENVPVYAFAGEVYTGFTGVSDVNGEVTLAIPEDDYRYAPDLPAGSPPADVQIAVTVEDTSSAPQAGLTVFVLSGSDSNDHKTYTGRSDVTDANGQVVLTLPQVGQYRFRVKNGSQSYYSDLTALCDPLSCSDVTVTIPGTGGDVVVTATDGLGQAIADNMVYAFDEDTYIGIFAETDVNGQATLSLPEGDYRFRTEVDEQYFFSDTVNHCTPPTCTSAQIAIPAVHAVTVSVQDEAANPQQDVVVYAFEGATYAEMNYTGISGKSDALGEVNFELPAGNYWFAYQQGDAAVDAGEAAVCVLPGCTTSTLTTTQNGTTTYVYDPLNRLTGATEVGTATREYGYTYDAVGNRLTKTIDGMTVNYVYDVANRLTSVDGVTYTWDNNGNLLSDGVFTYTYNVANRLTSVTDGVDTYAYAYNASGDRLQQTVNAVPTNYTLDLVAGLTQVLDDGTNAYLYGLERIAQEDTNGMLYFVPDALGSVRKLVDASGDIVNSTSYSPYGETAGMAETAYGFTGEWTDGMGLVNLRARYYAPYHNQFIQPDIIIPDTFNPQSLNEYSYVYNNPINYTDHSGYCIDGLTTIPCLVLLTGIAGFAGGAAIYEFNVIEHSWWESKEYAVGTFEAGMEAGLFATAVSLTLGQIALIAPQVVDSICFPTSSSQVSNFASTSNTSTSPINSPQPHSTRIGQLGEEAVYKLLNDPTAQREVRVYVNEAGRRSNYFARLDIVTNTAIHEVKNVSRLSLSEPFMEQASRYKLIADSAGMELHYWLVNDAPQSVVEWLLTLGIQVHTNIPGW